jgi:deoxyribodipyrimidine photo-lyase
MKPVIWWIRRDFRLQDNQALARALSHSSIVIPLFILDPHFVKIEGQSRRSFLFNAISSLNSDLLDRGSRLILREGDPVNELRSVLIESGAEKIFAEQDFSPYAKHRDSIVAMELPAEFVPGLTIFPPGSVQKADGTPYTIFTPFKHAWKSLPSPGHPLKAPIRFTTPLQLKSLKITPNNSAAYFPASETEAEKRFEHFISDHLSAYRTDRDRMDLSGTSNLSPYLKFGLISARKLAFIAKDYSDKSENEDVKKSTEAWLSELVWRDFYYSILDQFPFVLRRAFRESYMGIPWRTSKNDLDAWKNGLTGFPIVDAGMRQLRETGWMHNRARMITASFLAKDLLINWQEGEKWFMAHLIDGDSASNNGGWQWCAGTGTDAAPYFRIFNPILQGKKFDPMGKYIRRWLPELICVPDKYIHSPWEMPQDMQSMVGFHVGKDYPKPIVDHAKARERALAAYRSSQN